MAEERSRPKGLWGLLTGQHETYTVMTGDEAVTAYPDQVEYRGNIFTGYYVEQKDQPQLPCNGKS